MPRCVSRGQTTDPSSVQLRGQTLDLLCRYRRHPSISLRNRIVELNMGLVRQVAHRLCHQSIVPYDDLEQLGCLGLIRAIERFDSEQGYAFSSFAIPYIRGEILHYLRDQSTLVRIPRRWQCLQRQGAQAYAQLSSRLGRAPTEQEIADQMGVPLQDWQAAKLSQLNYAPVSLDASIAPGYSADLSMTLGEILPDHKEQTHQLIEQDRSQLHRALSQLEGQTRQILEFIFLQNLTRKQAAAQIGVSPMTVTRRVQKGLAQLTVLMQE